jgi:outer membrane protein TolC
LAAAIVLACGSARAEDGAQPVQLTLVDAVKRAVVHNPSAITAMEEIKRSEALVEQVRSTWYPTLTGNAVYTRLDGDRTLGGSPGNPATGTPPTAPRVIQAADSFNANLQLVVPLVQSRGWVATARAKDAVEIAKLAAVDAKVQVGVATGRAYLTVVAERRILDNAIRARDTAKAHEDFTKQRLDGGVGNRLDYVRAAQERATQDAAVSAVRIALVRSQEALGVLVGENGPVDVGNDADLAAPPTLAAALGEAETRRSDVVAQRERVETARKAVRDSYTEYLPVLSLVGQPFYQNPESLTLPTTGWQAQLVFALPIYDGGNRYGLTHERESLHEEAKTKLEGTLRQARSEVRVAFESMLRADEALAQAREAAKLATEALKLSQLAYQAGATSNLEVIDAERRSRDADTAAVIAEDAARQARLDLLAASGRFP